jgi:hypothetical protein
MQERVSVAAQPDATTASALRNMIMGFRTTQLIFVAAKLGLADHLRHEPQTPERLARRVGAEPGALGRLLRALASLGVFAETNEGAFALTPLGQLLETSSAGSLRGMAILYGEEWLWQAYGQMLASASIGGCFRRPASSFRGSWQQTPRSVCWKGCRSRRVSWCSAGADDVCLVGV